MAVSTPQAVQDCHELMVWLIPHLDKFPRARRFTLGERLESLMLAVLEELMAAAPRQRSPLRAPAEDHGRAAPTGPAPAGGDACRRHVRALELLAPEASPVFRASTVL